MSVLSVAMHAALLESDCCTESAAQNDQRHALQVEASDRDDQYVDLRSACEAAMDVQQARGLMAGPPFAEVVQTPMYALVFKLAAASFVCKHEPRVISHVQVRTKRSLQCTWHCQPLTAIRLFLHASVS